MTTMVRQQRHNSNREKRRKKLSTQYLAWLIHSFLGLKLTLILSLVLFTGAIGVVADEIDWLIYPEMRVEKQPGQTLLSPGEIADRVKQVRPELGVYYVVTYPDRPFLASYLGLNLPDGSRGKMWVNPYTGEINGLLDYLTVGRFFSDMHGNLFMGRPGRMLVNFTGILVLLALITGLVAFPKFWRYFLLKPRTGNLRVFLGDLHKLVGLWSLWIVLCIGISGSWWFYHFPFASYFNLPSLSAPLKSKPLLDYSQIPDKPTFMSASDLVRSVEDEFPGLKITLVAPPEHNSDTYSLVGLKNEWLVNHWIGSTFYVSPYSGEVITADHVTDRSPGQRFDAAMGPIHYGNWGTGSGHLPVKFAWFFGGLAMTFLSISGMLIYYKRARKASKRLKQYHWFTQYLPVLRSEKSQNAWRILHPYGGPMSIFKYLNVIVIFSLLIGCMQIIFFQPSDTANIQNNHQYPEQSLGPWLVSAHVPWQASIQAGQPINLNIDIPLEASDQIKFIYARVGKPRTLRAPGSIIHGVVGAKHVHMPIPARANPKSRLWLTAETWDGKFYQTSWPLFPTESNETAR